MKHPGQVAESRALRGAGVEGGADRVDYLRRKLGRARIETVRGIRDRLHVA